MVWTRQIQQGCEVEIQSYL